MAVSGLSPGSRVRALVECVGDDEHGVELRLPPGALGVVDRIDLFDNTQGVAITVALDAGIVNVFDQEDGPIGQVLELTDEPPAAPEPAIFDDPEALDAVMEASCAVTLNMLSHKGDPPNDAEVREIVYDGAEVLWFLLDQLVEPTAAEAGLKDQLSAWSDVHVMIGRRPAVQAAG